MPNRRRGPADAARAGRRQMAELADDLREARLGAGLTQRAVAVRMGVSQAQVSRVERGDYQPVRYEDLVQHAEAVGLRLSLRGFPASTALRDAAQVALIGRFRALVHGSYRARLEAPIPGNGDLRAWDLVLERPGLRIGVEAVTRLRDAQALLRAVRRKQRDSGMHRVIIVLAATVTNRRALAVADPALADFPVRTRSVMAALAAGKDPGTDAVVLL